MTDRLGVQRDDIGRVVRVLEDCDGPQTYFELDPDHAVEVGEELIRKGRELKSHQTSLAERAEDDDDQMTLAEGSDDGTESLDEMYDRLESSDRDPQEMGDVVNPDDPLKW